MKHDTQAPTSGTKATISHTDRDALRQAMAEVRKLIASADGGACDVLDLDELIARVDQELGMPHPSHRTLATFLNSIARSARSEHTSLAAVEKLDDVMRHAGIASDWES